MTTRGIAHLPVGPPPLRRLTSFAARDWRMLQLIADGARYLEVGKEVGLIRYSVKNRFKLLFDLSGADTLPALVAYGFRQGKLT